MTSINDSMNKIQGSINATNLAGDAQQTADSLNQAHWMQWNCAGN